MKVTQCTGEGMGSCKRCSDNGKWNMNWMCFLYKIEGYEGCYCSDCVKKIIQLIKKHHLDKELSEFKSWVENQKAEDESLRVKYKAGSDGYKSLTKRITLYNRAIREAEK